MPTAIGARLRRTAVFELSDCSRSARQRLIANSGSCKTAARPPTASRSRPAPTPCVELPSLDRSASISPSCAQTNCRQPRGERYCAGAPVRRGSPGCRSRFLSRRSVPARIRSRAVRVADARSSALLSTLRGRPGGRRVRLNASRSFGKMAHTGPTLIPYRRCLSSNRRT
jgi:hypothetical protein